MKLLGLVLAFVSAGCVQTSVNLDYVPKAASILRGPASFQAGEFIDLRSPVPPLHYRFSLKKGGLFAPDWEALAPRYLGTVPSAIIDGQAFPDHIFLNEPASVVVLRTVASALDARGMMANSTGRYFIVGEILELSLDTLKGHHAVARLRITVKDRAGRVLHSKIYTADRRSMDYYPGAGDAVVSLRKLAGHALQDAVDAALDDPAMRRAAH